MDYQKFVKPSEAELRQRLKPLEFEVTQHEATEPPFRNRYWDNHDAGIYVDLVSGEPLFSSKEKFDSGTGWPSFTAPIRASAIVVRPDTALGMTRTEVRSSAADSHLGHVFEDGPPPTGKRYCINSAALRFVPKAQLDAEGYGEFSQLFTTAVDDSSDATASAPAENSCNTPARGQNVGCRATIEIAYLAGGCFWGMQDILRKIPGVVTTEVGYMGGTTKNPSYDDVRTGTSGHAETVSVTFEPERISFEELLEKWFFRMHDPTTVNQQGHDVGSQYRSAIFVTSPAQRTTAEAVKLRVQQSGLWKRPIVTEITEAQTFTAAEPYHQDYLEKHPGGYTCHYLR